MAAGVGDESLLCSGLSKSFVLGEMARPDTFAFFESRCSLVRSVRSVTAHSKTLVGTQEKWGDPDAPSTANREVSKGSKSLGATSAAGCAASSHFATNSFRRTANCLGRDSDALQNFQALSHETLIMKALLKRAFRTTCDISRVPGTWKAVFLGTEAAIRPPLSLPGVVRNLCLSFVALALTGGERTFPSSASLHGYFV